MKAVRAILLLAPAALIVVGFVALPLLAIVEESFRKFTPGYVGADLGAPLTLDNYLELVDPAYLNYFWETLRLALLASVIGIGVSFPIAYIIARQRSKRIRSLLISLLVVVLFLSVLVRVYSFAVTFGPMGFGPSILKLAGMASAGSTYTEVMVTLGLMHYVIPLSSLMLTGSIQNINPRLTQAAINLGASSWQAHLTVTLPLAMTGIASAFLISFTLSMSSFVIPMVLGAGRVVFVSNLIYRRFGEMANYPSGSAISIVMLLLCLLFVYFVTRTLTGRGRET